MFLPTSTRCIIAPLHLPAASNGTVAHRTVALSTSTLPDRNRARCRMPHTSIRRRTSTRLGIATRRSGITNFRRHLRLLPSLPRVFRSWGLITLETIMRMGTQALTQIPSGILLILARLESILNFRSPLEILLPTVHNLHRDPMLETHNSLGVACGCSLLYFLDLTCMYAFFLVSSIHDQCIHIPHR